jgi:hypothetical protein
MADPASHSPEVLRDGILLPLAAAVAYTSPVFVATERGTRIQDLTLTNQTTAAVLVQIWVVEAGGARGNANRVVNDLSVPADGFPYAFLEGYLLDPGDTIEWLAGIVNAVAGRIAGWEMTD